MDYFLVWQWTLFNATNINGFQSLLTLYYDALYDTLMITMHALNWINIGISMCIYVNDKGRKDKGETVEIFNCPGKIESWKNIV